MFGIPGPLIAGVPVWTSGSNNAQYSDATATTAPNNSYVEAWSFMPGRSGTIQINFRLYGQDGTGYRHPQCRIRISNDGGSTYDDVWLESNNGVSTDNASISNVGALASIAGPNLGSTILLKKDSIIRLEVRVQNAAQSQYINATVDNLVVKTMQGVITPSPFVKLYP